MKKTITFLTLFVISFLLISCDYRNANVELRCPSSSYSSMKFQISTETCYYIFDSNSCIFDGADGLQYSARFIGEDNILITAINCNDSILKSYRFKIDNCVSNRNLGIRGYPSAGTRSVIVKSK